MLRSRDKALITLPVFRSKIALLSTLVFVSTLFSAEAKTKKHHHSSSHHGRHGRRVRHSSSFRITSGSSYRVETRITPRPFTTVVIDAGHGGQDFGGIPSNLIPEKGVALDVALRLRNRLGGYGIRTVMTRYNDTFIPLPERVAISNSQPSAIFVSIHFNAGARREAHGFETYFCSPESMPLAEHVQSHLMETVPTENRGVKQAFYYVLRRANTVAVLAECGFLTNPGEANLARSAWYRQKLADEIGAAIAEYKRGLD